MKRRVNSVGRLKSAKERTDKVRENKLLAMQEAMAWATVGIGFTNPALGHGSGVAVKIAGRYFIATANHVIEDEPRNENLLFVCRTETPLSYVGDKKEIPARLFGGKEKVDYNIGQRFHIRQRLADKIADVALLELTGPPSLQKLQFHEILDLNRRTPRAGTEVAITGFAGEIAQQVEHRPTGTKGVMLFPYSDLPQIVPPRDDLSGFDKRIHFLMDYPYDPALSARPQGMSGCGVWLIHEQEIAKIWSLEGLSLVGIQTHWYERSALLKAARIQRLLKLASEQ